MTKEIIIEITVATFLVLAIIVALVTMGKGQTTVTMGGQFRATSSVKVTWDASATGGVTYTVYRGPTGGPYLIVKDTVACCQYRDLTVPAKRQACYVVTAVDGSNNESVQSNPESCVQVP